jgi:hypothetical protein
MKIGQALVPFALMGALAACIEETRNPLPENIMDLPESQALSSCLDKAAAYYATKGGNAIDLGYLGAGRCATERWAFLKRTSNGNLRVMENLEPEAVMSHTRIVADGIIQRRGY